MDFFSALPCRGGGAKRRRGLTSTKTYFMCVSVGVPPSGPLGQLPYKAEQLLLAGFDTPSFLFPQPYLAILQPVNNGQRLHADSHRAQFIAAMLKSFLYEKSHAGQFSP